MAAVISEALEEGRQLFIAQKQGLNVRKKHFLPQTLPEEWRYWQVLQAEEGIKSHLPPKDSAVCVPRLRLDLGSVLLGTWFQCLRKFVI